ncbi:glycosyltransferase [Aliarcobacter butzleri]|uniref:glycosyltransferase n=1 Tax=Aliarcobacter butzleri TaxID=28197 RepID=UPI001EDC29A1|nr:glycosyltransferase [Aliarcobacter butzleri]MCG3710613.1 glycosyltransferase [Aliarcobacter butzleri]MCG3714126.1 glycosyltransferase [Aliarcobacter butzleri]
MIKVGFIGAVSKEWMGGLNYFKNLLHSISLLENKKIEPIVFVGIKTDEDIKAMFRKYATVIEHSIFDRKSLNWYLMKIEQKIFNTNFFLSNLLKKYNIKVLSHASIVNLYGIKSVNWIPDFQHIHLPNMFSQKELNFRDKDFKQLILKSDAIVLSSYDALNDFNNFAVEYKDKAKVLQFVSQPDKKYFELTEDNKVALLNKYNLVNEFYYMPNQFWKHKNHMIVFEAVKQLVEENKNICLVCTGHLKDYRNIEHINEILDFIKINKLENNIKLLGLVDYEDVFALIKFSKAVINPSLFEGWSSTVEECKSVGKNMILSDLNVHKEQYPEALFFERNSVNSLKNILKNYNVVNDLNVDDLENRIKLFANNYEEIILKVLND